MIWHNPSSLLQKPLTLVGGQEALLHGNSDNRLTSTNFGFVSREQSCLSDQTHVDSCLAFGPQVVSHKSQLVHTSQWYGCRESICEGKQKLSPYTCAFCVPQINLLPPLRCCYWKCIHWQHNSKYSAKKTTGSQLHSQGPTRMGERQQKRYPKDRQPLQQHSWNVGSPEICSLTPLSSCTEGVLRTREATRGRSKITQPSEYPLGQRFLHTLAMGPTF